MTHVWCICFYLTARILNADNNSHQKMLKIYMVIAYTSPGKFQFITMKYSRIDYLTGVSFVSCDGIMIYISCVVRR